MAMIECAMNADLRVPMYEWEGTLYAMSTYVCWIRTDDVNIAHILSRTKIVYID